MWSSRQTVKKQALDGLRTVASGVVEALGAGPAHRRRLDEIDTRIVVSGVRGKSSVANWLHEQFVSRGYDTYTKITGSDAQVRYNDTVSEIEREQQVRLYENERELARFDSIDVAIVENQGIRPYTTRLVNEQFVDPDLVFLTNVREDHLDTLGRDRTQIARSLTRAVPQGTSVVCAEQYKPLREYIQTELERRDAPVTFVDPPSGTESVPGSECVYGLNDVLAAVGEPPVPTQEIQDRIDTLRPSWQQLPGGRVYNAAAVNDVQSTELVRQSLVEDRETVIEPVLNLRWDRRGRTVSFIRYLDDLYESGAVEQTHIVGDDQQLFETTASLPVVRHDTETESPAAVLDDAVASGRPVVLMGNTVTAFMEAMAREIESRAGTDSDAPEATTASETA
jgi:hypothetical protein